MSDMIGVHFSTLAVNTLVASLYQGGPETTYSYRLDQTPS